MAYQYDTSLFTGSAEEIAWKSGFHVALKANEIGPLSPYSNQWANTAESGSSYGWPQWDLSVQGNDQFVETFLTILKTAKNADGTYIIEDGDIKTDRSNDTKIAGIMSVIKLKGPTQLDDDTKSLVNLALDSSIGRSLIDSAYNTHMSENPGQIPVFSNIRNDTKTEVKGDGGIKF